MRGRIHLLNSSKATLGTPELSRVRNIQGPDAGTAYDRLVLNLQGTPNIREVFRVVTSEGIVETTERLFLELEPETARRVGGLILVQNEPNREFHHRAYVAEYPKQQVDGIIGGVAVSYTQLSYSQLGPIASSLLVYVDPLSLNNCPGIIAALPLQ